MRAIVERMDAHINPMMLKEVYQGMRGTGFVAGTGVALCVLLASFAIPILSGESFQEGFAAVLAMVVSVIAVVIVPGAVGRGLRDEILSQTIELIVITGMSPWRLVVGRFLGGMLRLAVVFSCTAPFAAGSVIMGGVDLEQMTFAYLMVAAASVFTCGLMLALNALAAVGSHFSAVLKLQAFIPIIPLWIFLGVLGGAGLRLEDEVWLVGLAAAVAAGLCALFCLGLAADLLMPAGVRNFSRSKLLMGLPPLALLAGGIVSEPSLHNLAVWCFGGMLPIYPLAVFWSATTAKRREPRLWLLRDGFLPSVSFCVLVSGALALVTLFDPSSDRSSFLGTWSAAVGTLIFSTGSALLIWRILDRQGSKPLLYLVGLMVTGLVQLVVGVGYGAYVDWQVDPFSAFLSPFMLLVGISEQEVASHWSLVPWGMGVVFYLLSTAVMKSPPRRYVPAAAES